MLNEYTIINDNQISEFNNKVLQKEPLTFNNSLFEGYIYPDKVKMSCLSIVGKYYELDPYFLTCNCPEFKNKYRVEGFDFRSSCVHRYEWLAYAPEELIINSLYPKAIWDKCFAQQEQTNEKVLCLNINDMRVTIIISKDCHRFASSFNELGYLRIEYEQLDKLWINVYFEGDRYGYGWRNGCWSLIPSKFKLIAPLVSMFINKELLDCFKVAPELIGKVTESMSSIHYKGHIQSLTITMSLELRARYIKIESNLFCRLRFDTSNKQFLPARNNQFDDRYYWCKKSLLSACENMIKQRTTLIAEIASQRNQKKLEINEERRKAALIIKNNKVLSSDSKQIKFGIKKKCGELYYYVTFESAEVNKLSKMKKLTLKNTIKVPFGWIFENYNYFSQFEKKTSIYPWSELTLEQFIQKRLNHYGEFTTSKKLRKFKAR